MKSYVVSSNFQRALHDTAKCFFDLRWKVPKANFQCYIFHGCKTTFWLFFVENIVKFRSITRSGHQKYLIFKNSSTTLKLNFLNQYILNKIVILTFFKNSKNSKINKLKCLNVKNSSILPITEKFFHYEIIHVCKYNKINLFVIKLM